MINLRIVLTTAFLRALGTGATGVLVGLYLARLGESPGASGLTIGLGLGGAATASFLATIAADRFGRRRFLVVLALFAVLGGIAFALASHTVALMIAAFVGMVNGMGRDRGAALVIEQTVLPTVTDDAGRTRVFAWYNLLQDVGHALGSLLAGAPALLRAMFHMGELEAMRIVLAAAAGLTLVALVFYTRLTAVVEAPPGAARVRVSPETKRTLFRLCSLFSLDALGGGFLTSALVAFFFYKRFGVDESLLGPLFFGARVLNALSHLGAAWLAKRIGLVNTMVFTHMPSSLLLLTVAIAPSFPVAAVLFLLREGLVEMDVPTRQSYVMAVVKPEERTVASGVTQLVRMAMWAIAPPFAGLLMQGLSMGAPLVIASAMKLSYDVLLWRAFRHVKPPEERAATS